MLLFVIQIRKSGYKPLPPSSSSIYRAQKLYLALFTQKQSPGCPCAEPGSLRVAASLLGSEMLPTRGQGDTNHETSWGSEEKTVRLSRPVAHDQARP
jgi:hypothetical protein